VLYYTTEEQQRQYQQQQQQQQQQQIDWKRMNGHDFLFRLNGFIIVAREMHHSLISVSFRKKILLREL
jgi:hypothetical protein